MCRRRNSVLDSYYYLSLWSYQKKMLLSLNNFLDKNSLITVGNRFQNSMLSDVQRHPFILPSKHKLTELIIELFSKHVSTYRITNLLYCDRREFWFPKGRSNCRKIIYKCVIYFRAKTQNIRPNYGRTF